MYVRLIWSTSDGVVIQSLCLRSWVRPSLLSHRRTRFCELIGNKWTSCLKFRSRHGYSSILDTIRVNMILLCRETVFILSQWAQAFYGLPISLTDVLYKALYIKGYHHHYYYCCAAILDKRLNLELFTLICDITLFTFELIRCFG